MEEKKILTLKELIPMAIGNVLGAGAFTHIGFAIGYTGYSAWLAYLAAVILGILFCLPIIIMTSALQLDGGVYTLVGQILGKRAAGIYASGFLFYFPGIAIVALSLGNYVHSLWPAISPRWCAVAVVTLFYLLNLAGVKKISKAQKIIMAVTLCALFGFVFFGVLHISPDVFAFSREDFLQGGVKGFFKAVFILFLFCYRLLLYYVPGEKSKGGNKKHPGFYVCGGRNDFASLSGDRIGCGGCASAGNSCKSTAHQGGGRDISGRAVCCIYVMWSVNGIDGKY